MKKLILSLVLSLAAVAAIQAQVIISTNVTSAGTTLVSTNRVSAYSFEVAATNAITLYFYDQDNMADPYFGTNWVTGAYISRSTFPTNIASSYVNPNGYTNWYTNAGLFTLTTTNAAATNSLPAMAVINVGANETRVAYVPAIFTRGIVMRSTGNASVAIYAQPAN